MKRKRFIDIVSKQDMEQFKKADRKQWNNCKNLALKYAQYQTMEQWDCIDNNNHTIPWYTYPAIEYINNIDFSDKLIFEYGCGNSSLYWAARAKKIVSIENNREWFDKIKKSKMDNQQIILCEDEMCYPHEIEKYQEKFDVIIIDGIMRSECSKVIENYLNYDKGYLIILDNADWYPNTAKYLRETYDLLEVDFHGFGPINAYTWTTSFFFSRNIQLTPINNMQPDYSLCAIKKLAD